MKLFLLTLSLLLALTSPKIFPLHQLRIKNYLHRKPVTVRVSSSSSNYTFRSFISRNSRGILLEVIDPKIVKSDQTEFFKKVSTPNHDQSYAQVLLDYRLISLCRFHNKSPAKHAKQLSFGFDITNKDIKSTTTYKVDLIFEGLVRNEQLVNDVHEFKQALKQLRNSCQTRKNHLKNRRDWFTAKGDELYDTVKKMKNSQGLRSRFLDPNSPLNIDNRIALAVQNHRKVADTYKSLRSKATKVATYIGGLESQALQLERNRADDSQAAQNAKRELENAKFHLDTAKIEYSKTQKDLLRDAPEARNLINKAHGQGDQKDHQNEMLKLSINS